MDSQSFGKIIPVDLGMFFRRLLPFPILAHVRIASARDVAADHELKCSAMMLL
jgi:branched-subunit amino acid transport protein AzlD